MSGVEATTNENGYLAARLAPGVKPPGSLAEAASRLKTPSDVSPLERQLTTELKRMCSLARSRARYPLPGLLALINIRGGLRAAQQLLSEGRVSDSFVALTRLGHLDLTVESVVLRPEYTTLFTDAERATAATRLDEARQRLSRADGPQGAHS